MCIAVLLIFPHEMQSKQLGVIYYGRYSSLTFSDQCLV